MTFTCGRHGWPALDCHTADEMHGIGRSRDETHRYDGEPDPTCKSCHEDQIGVGSGILLHECTARDSVVPELPQRRLYQLHQLSRRSHRRRRGVLLGRGARNGLPAGQNPLRSAERP